MTDYGREFQEHEAQDENQGGQRIGHADPLDEEGTGCVEDRGAENEVPGEDGQGAHHDQSIEDDLRTGDPRERTRWKQEDRGQHERERRQPARIRPGGEEGREVQDILVDSPYGLPDTVAQDSQREQPADQTLPA